MEVIEQEVHRPQVVTLHPYQQEDFNKIIDRLENRPANHRLLYQLPTGGGKTMIFSEIAKHFIEATGRKVLVLTHRTELSRQTSAALKHVGVANKIINSSIRAIPKSNRYECYVAMVQTLKNRIRSKKMFTGDIGLVIIDEAHHNSFRKLLQNFNHAFIIGVTATPLSSDKEFPMKNTYDELVNGQNIHAMIADGYLAAPKVIKFDVELTTLSKGIHGDFTVSSSDALYASSAMLNLLLRTYEENSKGKKTLIFNNGIFASKCVCEAFKDAGYPIKHLDNKTPAAERTETLRWFKKTKDAILTSVSLLTTGFDEPSIQTVILNRATTSLTLYHQMIGRGSRVMPRKKSFTLIDLGNNESRFGEWQAPLDWHHIFEHPEDYYDRLSYGTGSESGQSHHIDPGMRAKFPNSLEISFDIEQAFLDAIAAHGKTKNVIRDSIRQHVLMCMENSGTVSEALHLADELDNEIDWRVKQYVKCLENTTKSYREWLDADYKARLRTMIRKLYIRKMRRDD